MNWKIVLSKVGKGALAGALASLTVIQPQDGDDIIKVALTAVLTGAVTGGWNAWKHRNLNA